MGGTGLSIIVPAYNEASSIRSVNILGLIVRTVMYFAPLRVLLPISGSLLLLALAILILSALPTPKVMDVTVIVITMAALQIAVAALVADLIEKRH